MANKQTRAFRKVGASTKMNRGVTVYTSHGSNSVETGALTFQTFEVATGYAVNSSEARANRGRKKYASLGDPLGRNR